MKKLMLLAFMLFFVQHHYAQNVGIGTTTPTLGKLDIRGADGTTLLNLSSDEGNAGVAVSNPSGYPTLGLNVRLGPGYARMGTGFGSILQYGPGDGLLRYFSTGATGAPGSSAVLTHRFTIDQAGNLGIGISVPKAKLHATSMLIGSSAATPATGYLLSVSGKMICEETRIQLNGAWPDYVFSEQYKLPSITELEIFIRKNKHLPNMPSAAKVEQEKGFDVGDLQKRMLEKIEEMALYIIQLKKENELLQERVKTLEEKTPLPQR